MRVYKCFDEGKIWEVGWKYFVEVGGKYFVGVGWKYFVCFAANVILKKLGFWGASLLFQILIVALSIFKIKNNKKVCGSNNIFSWIFLILQKWKLWETFLNSEHPSLLPRQFWTGSTKPFTFIRYKQTGIQAMYV